MHSAPSSGKHLKHQLLYPFQPEVLYAMVLMYTVAVPLFLTRSYWMDRGNTSPDVWTVLNWTGVTLFLTLLVEYGLSIIDVTVSGNGRPPGLDIKFMTREVAMELVSIIGQSGNLSSSRLMKQQLMVMAFLGLSWYLEREGLAAPAILVTLFFVVLLPASLAVNAVSGRLRDMLNPYKLVAFIRLQGRSYGLCVLFLLVAYQLFYTALYGDIFLFLSCIPGGLYCTIVMFRILAQSIYANKAEYIEEVDIRAERKSLEEIGRKNASLDMKLRGIYNQLKNKQTDQAVSGIRQLLESNDWHNFAQIFRYISDWPDKTPALAVIPAYLPVAVERRQYMQALDLCQWCLRQDISFTVQEESVLAALSEQAATEVQYRVMIRLLENYADHCADNRRPFLEKAAEMAGRQLKDEARFSGLVDKLNGG